MKFKIGAIEIETQDGNELITMLGKLYGSNATIAIGPEAKESAAPKTKRTIVRRKKSALPEGVTVEPAAQKTL